MDKIIKTLTLLFFVAGISLFVAYNSGCFTAKNSPSPSREKPNIFSGSSDENRTRLSSSKSFISSGFDGYKRDARAQFDSLFLLTVDTNIIQAEIDSLKQCKFRMYSSKAIIIGAEKEHAAIDKRLKLLENILTQNQ